MTNQTSAPEPLPLSQADERNWAMLAHLSVLINLVTGILGPVVALGIYVIYGKRSRFVAYHSLQAFVNQLIWWVGGGTIIGTAWAISGILSFAIVGLCLMPFACVLTLMPLISIYQGVMAGIKTSQGEDYKYWWVGDWLRGTLEN